MELERAAVRRTVGVRKFPRGTAVRGSTSGPTARKRGLSG